MGFDFVNTRLVGATGPFTITSASVAYPVLNANVTIATVTTLGEASTGSLIIRNGLVQSIIGNFTSSNRPL